LTVINRRRGRPSRAEAQRRADHLLDVAAAVFVEQGYSAATIEGIAQAAGFWKQAIYQRYSDKRALYAAVVKRLAALQPFPFPTDDDLPLAEGLRLRVHYMLTTFLQPEGQAIYTLFMRDSHRFPELVEIISNTANHHFLAPLKRYLRRQRQLGRLRGNININAAATSCADMVYGCMMRFFLIENLRVDKKDIKRTTDQIVDLLVNGLLTHD
jgi:AcrR family transcriptional regulator